MSIIASITELAFEPKMPVTMDALGEVLTPVPYRPRLGPLANLTYKPCKVRWVARFSAESVEGDAVLRVYKGETEAKTINLPFQGETVLSGEFDLEVGNTSGTLDWSIGVEVTTPGDTGLTAEVDAKMVVETPVTVV